MVARPLKAARVRRINEGTVSVSAYPVFCPLHVSIDLRSLAFSVTCNLNWEHLVGSVKNARSTRVKVQEHRNRLRAQGLRPIQIWVPDVRAASFRKEAHRQSLAVSRSAQAREDQAFIDAVSDWQDE